MNLQQKMLLSRWMVIRIAYTAGDKDIQPQCICTRKGNDSQRIVWVEEGWVRNSLGGTRSKLP